jgi:H/ACA ribonucleoprotein complex subunit 4
MLWENYGVEEVMRRVIKPVEYMVKHLPRVWVRDSAVDSICHGASLAVPGIARITSNITKDSLVAMMTLKGELISLGIAAMSSREILEAQRGIAVKTTRVVMRRGTYPPTWRKGGKAQ